MRRSIPGIAGSLALVLGLAACGGGDSESDTEGSGTTPEASEVSGELTWWDTSDPANEGPTFQELIERFIEPQQCPCPPEPPHG